MMDHLVFVDHPSHELDKLLSGEKSLIIRGSTGRKNPYERVKPGEILYFINNNGDGLVRAAAIVKSVSNSEMLSPEDSIKLLMMKKNELGLEPEQFNQYINKRNVVLIEVKDVCRIMEFRLDKNAFQTSGDWIPIDNIEVLKKRYR